MKIKTIILLLTFSFSSLHVSYAENQGEPETTQKMPKCKCPMMMKMMKKMGEKENPKGQENPVCPCPCPHMKKMKQAKSES